MNKSENKNTQKEKKEIKENIDIDKNKDQIKLRVFEEDDYFEEFEEGNKNNL